MGKAYINYDQDLSVNELSGRVKENGDFACYDGRIIYKLHHLPTKKAAILDLINTRLEQIEALQSEIIEIREKYKDDLA